MLDERWLARAARSLLGIFRALPGGSGVIDPIDRKQLKEWPVARGNTGEAENGELVRFDLGCVYQGYRSDISRTAVLGKPTDKQARYYAAILAGERAAIAAMKPGVPVSQLFDVAVRVTRESGLPHYQRHHVGHGIGLEPYDPPTINAATATALEPGMVFCVETPYYEHGWGGVQVEDAVEITASGARILTPSRADLIVVG